MKIPQAALVFLASSGACARAHEQYLRGMQQKLGDWEFCALSSECNNGCCSSKYSDDGRLKCTPLNGGFDPTICSTGSAPTPPASAPTNAGSGLLGDWEFCASNSACSNGCCSSVYSDDGQSKCTPLVGGFNPNICMSGSVPPPVPAPTTGSGLLGDWELCASNSACSNGCCSSMYYGQLKCTPLDGGFNPDVCMGGSPPVSAPTTGSSGSCGGGNRGDGICADGSCCSEFGWCGTTPEHCAGTTPAPAPTDGTMNINSPAVILTTTQVQAGVIVKGDSTEFTTQAIVDLINQDTSGYSLYRQIAFVAHTIWESGSYQYREELAKDENREAYQDCDWSTEEWELPDNGKFFYGRGFLQLSWCANYKAYGAARMFNLDPDLFYNQPELVAADPFAMDSAAWFFETIVSDTTGQFGLTTKAINGDIECSAESEDGNATARKRYEVFVAIANAVGMGGFSENGCYN